MAYHELYPEEYQQLIRKLIKDHPDILEKCKRQQLEEALGTIAAELGILCDGVYDLIPFCKVLLIELDKRNASVIYQLPPGSLH